jgi:hypothetical protein
VNESLFRRKKLVNMVPISFSLSVLLPLIFTTMSLAAPSALPKRATGPDDQLAATALDNVYKILAGTISDGTTHTGCTKETLAVRKE